MPERPVLLHFFRTMMKDVDRFSFIKVPCLNTSPILSKISTKCPSFGYSLIIFLSCIQAAIASFQLNKIDLNLCWIVQTVTQIWNV